MTERWRILRIVALTLLALRVAMLFVVRPFMDETYYWMWGQHPALSYFDHPALIGWTQSLASGLGWSTAALRLPVLLTLLGDVAMLQLIAMHQGGEWRERFWLVTAVFLSTPIFVLLTGSALPDHLLIFFALLTLWAAESFAVAETPRWRYLYLAGLAIGFATLSKYTGAMLGACLLIWLAMRHRVVFRSPHFYAAALLALLLQAPVLIWNMQNGFASFGFVVAGRSGLHAPTSLVGLAGYLGGTLAVLSPFLIWPLARFLLARRDGHGLGRTVFWLSSVIFLVASLFTNILIHWNVLAYVAVLPFLAPFLRSRLLLGAQVTYGVLVIGLAMVNFALLPLNSLVGSAADQTSAWSYGWDEVAAEVRRIQQREAIGFVAATDYALASPLGFALADPNITNLSPKRDQYDYWFDPEAHRGQAAVIVADRWRGLSDRVSGRFGSVERVGEIEVERFGRKVDSYRIYIARDFGASSQAQ